MLGAKWENISSPMTDPRIIPKPRALLNTIFRHCTVKYTEVPSENVTLIQYNDLVYFIGVQDIAKYSIDKHVAKSSII